MRFLLDNNLSPRLADLLRSAHERGSRLTAKGESFEGERTCLCGR